MANIAGTEHLKESNLPALFLQAQECDDWHGLVRISSTCLVTVARNRYSVPCEWAGHRVSARLYPTQVAIVADDTIVARHERLTERHQIGFDWQRYIPLIARKPGALRNGAPFADMPAALLQLKRGLL